MTYKKDPDFEDVFVVIEVSQPFTSKNGNTFYRVLVSDVEQTFTLFYWNSSISISRGDFIRAKGSTFTQGSTLCLSSKPSEIAVLSEEEKAQFRDAFASVVFSYPISGEEFHSIILKHTELCSEPIKKFLREFFSPATCGGLYTKPGGKSAHHSKPGGLIYHTVEMLDLYCSSKDSLMFKGLNYDVMVTAILFHDYGKLFDYEEDENGSYTYADSFYRTSHIVSGAQEFLVASRCWQLDEAFSSHVHHCILSHHGKLEYGSPVVPATREALTIHFIDELSAKNDMFTYTPLGESNRFLNTKPQIFK